MPNEDFDLGRYELAQLPSWYLWEDWVPLEPKFSPVEASYILWVPAYQGRSIYWLSITHWYGSDHGCMMHMCVEVEV